MKTLIIVLTAFFAIGTTASAQKATSTAQKEIQKTMYTCSMHPKVMSDKKGECPKCGMDLVVSKEAVHTTAVKGSQTPTATKAKYVCTMDGSTSDKPGKCPKCGMTMTEEKSDEKEMKH
jgi:rubrerythrin